MKAVIDHVARAQRQTHRSASSGFTLVELMIVVVILGILAAVAIPAFTRYIKKSKTVEAARNIASIYQAQGTYYAQSAERPDSTGGFNPPVFVGCPYTPSGAPTAQRRAGDWTGNWTALGFGTDTPVYYSYQVTAAGTGNTATATISANGDLDANGIQSTFTRTLAISTSGDVIGTALSINNELE